eukprot:TRINITY_DN52062_c0_g1_i1.p3 TRINITY_DN52062_c0_g1~~TRINITY_DN52062_c0_g1_i1.p3  ORF type:complete len:246 (-),score=54.42 TRINITY_DN52062_c0_g1_i1:151-825(-)
MKALKNRWLEKYNQEQQEEIQQLSNQETPTDSQGAKNSKPTENEVDDEVKKGEGKEETQQVAKVAIGNNEETVPVVENGKRAPENFEDDSRETKRIRVEEVELKEEEDRNAADNQNLLSNDQDKTPPLLNDKSSPPKQQALSCRIVKCSFEGQGESKDVELQGQGDIQGLLMGLKKVFNLQKLEDSTRITYKDGGGDWLVLSEHTPWQNFVQNVQQLKVVVNLV